MTRGTRRIVPVNPHADQILGERAEQRRLGRQAPCR